VNDSNEPLKFVASLHPAEAGINDSTLASSDGVTICPVAEFFNINKKKKINLSTFNFQKLIKNLISCKSKKEI
jgi:hypothetical protein